MRQVRQVKETVNPPPHEPSRDDRASTGVGGLDHLLRGGLPAHRIHLVEGHPGSGKTTLGLQFLMEGVRRGESCMYITLSETAEELRASAASHGVQPQRRTCRAFPRTFQGIPGESTLARVVNPPRPCLASDESRTPTSYGT